ncbi:hypothetical protein MRB53_040101 [Persea americana]|nr:hypothetical protein MRB53_040101 [Persea americana]
MFAPKYRAYGISAWGMAAVLGPVLGTIWELMWLSGFCLVVLFFFLPESSASNIIYRRTARLRKVAHTGDIPLRCGPEIEAENMSGKDIAMMVLIRPFSLTFTEPVLLALNLYIALLYALLYIWFESFPIVFGGFYGFDDGEIGLAFLGILVGALITLPPFWWFLHVHTEPKFDENGDLTPELRLPPACVGGFCVTICLFWFGWTARPSVHWIVPIIGSGLFSIGAFLLFNSVLNYIGDAYPKYAASAFAGNDLMRSSFGAAFPLFAGAMYNNLGVPWASSTLAFLSMLFIPVPFILIRWGKQLRMRSKMARHDI